jgi:nitrite reductase (NADH) small subunit
MMPEFVKVAKVSELLPGDARVVECAGKTLALCNVDGTFYAVDNTCPHRGGPLGEGFLDGDRITCPWHGWQFELTTGQNALPLSAGVACYPTRIEGDDILIGV